MIAVTCTIKSLFVVCFIVLDLHFSLASGDNLTCVLLCEIYPPVVTCTFATKLFKRVFAYQAGFSQVDRIFLLFCIIL